MTSHADRCLPRLGRRCLASLVRACVVIAVLSTLALQSTPSVAQAVGGAPLHLRIVGGLGGVNQYTRYEEPFWTHELARLSGGGARAEIVPVARARIRGPEEART